MNWTFSQSMQGSNVEGQNNYGNQANSHFKRYVNFLKDVFKSNVGAEMVL